MRGALCVIINSMIPVLSTENMRKSDKYATENGVSGRELMYRAGEAVFDAIKARSHEFFAPFAIVCGGGNNAGDGYVLALLMKRSGIDCRVYTLFDKFSDDGRYYYELCAAEGVAVERFFQDADFGGFSTIVDCIFGTGYRGGVSGDARGAVSAINRAGERGARVISVDMNSGLCGDSGICEPCACVRSDLTISIGGFKSGHFLGMAKDYIAQKINCDIGIAPVERCYRLFEAGDLPAAFIPRRHFSNKSTYGYVALVGGSSMYGGAIRLAAMANAAMRSGAGVVTVAVPAVIAPEVAVNILESTLLRLSDDGGEMVFAEGELRRLVGKYRVIAFGMGVGLGCGAERALAYFLENYSGTLIIDADGLTLLARMGMDAVRAARCSIVLTPHSGEFARLAGLSAADISAAPIACAENFVRSLRCGSAPARVLLLKGASTVITDGFETYIVDAGCAGMATAGSGDVLSGVLAAVCANFSHIDDGAQEPESLAYIVSAGAYICGKAGEAAERKVGAVSMVASDTVAEIQGVIAPYTRPVRLP